MPETTMQLEPIEDGAPAGALPLLSPEQIEPQEDEQGQPVAAAAEPEGEGEQPAVDLDALRAELEAQRRANAGLRSDLIRNRQEAARLKAREESLAALEAKINARLDPPAPPPDPQQDPVRYIEHRQAEAVKPITEKLDRFERFIAEQEERSKVEGVQAAIASRLTAEIGGDQARRSEYEAQAEHVFGIFQRLYGDAAPIAAVQKMAEVVQNGGLISEYVADFAASTGWQGQAQAAPVQPTQAARMNVPPGAIPIKAPKSLGAMGGGTAGVGRRITTDNYEQWATENPAEAYALMNSPRWRELNETGSTTF